MNGMTAPRILADPRGSSLQGAPDAPSRGRATASVDKRTTTAALSASDETLIGRIANGDRLAMQVLYARHHVRIFRYVLRLVGNAASAEDLTSDVFLDVWRQAARFEARSTTATWLLTIARFKAYSALRRPPHAELTEEMAEAIENTSGTPETALQEKDEGQVLRRCLGRLSPQHREIVDLVYYHGKSVEQVAQLIGICESTVRTRMFYARKRLGELVREAGLDRGSLRS